MKVENIGKKMIMYRAKHNLTQQQLGKMLGVTNQSICNYESGVKPVHKMVAIKFEMLLKKEL